MLPTTAMGGGMVPWGGTSPSTAGVPGEQGNRTVRGGFCQSVKSSTTHPVQLGYPVNRAREERGGGKKRKEKREEGRLTAAPVIQ